MKLKLKQASTLTILSGAMILALGSMEAAAQEQPAAVDLAKDVDQQDAPAFFRLDYSGDLWEQPALTGDWGGSRSELARKGISFELDLEQTVQGSAHGGKDTNNAFRKEIRQ